jgi:hypothetical protein
MADVSVGNISDNSGEVNIAGGDIIQNIKTIHQRALTASEEAAQARKLERQLLAQGIGMLMESLSAQASQVGESNAPYKGLLSYGLSEAQMFYGRKKAKKDLLTCIHQSSLTILHAESGAGKSSLLQAGIAAHLIASGHLVVYLRPHDAEPVDFIKQVFLPELTQAHALEETSLREFLRQVCVVLGPKVNLYLFLDQFEEFFQFLKKEERQRFLSALADCLNDPGLNVRWVLAVRGEALSNLSELESFGIDPFKNTYRLNRLSRAEAREVMVEPARRFGIQFEQALIDHVLDTLTANDEVMPTHLQLVCSALTDDLPEDKILTLAYYREQEGDTERILREYLKRQLEHLSAEEQDLAWKVLRALITSDHHRGVKTYNEIMQELKIYSIDAAKINTILARLIQRRLLITQMTSIETYELAHDYLLGEIALDPATIQRKQAEELLNDGFKVWRRDHKLLLGKEHLANLETEERKLPLSMGEEKAALLLLSAVWNDKPPDLWLPKLDQKAVDQLISNSLADWQSKDATTRQVAGKVLWVFRQQVPWGVVLPLYTQHATRWMLRAIPTLVLMTVVLGLSFLWLFTPLISDWEALTLKDPAGNAATKLVVALSPTNADEVYAASQSAGWISASMDGGLNWRTITVTNKSALQGLAASGSTLYAIGEHSLFASADKGSSWTEAHSNPGSSDLTAVTTDPHNPEHVFIGTSSGEILKSADGGKTWTQLPKGYEGESVRALAANSEVLLAATDRGLWVDELAQDTWRSISLQDCDGHNDPASQVTSVALPLANDPKQIWLWAAISGKGICDSDYKNQFGSSILEDVPYKDVSSVAITGDPVQNRNSYLATPNGLVRQRTWHWFEAEWWKAKLHR